jgi:hypothetical protein
MKLLLIIVAFFCSNVCQDEKNNIDDPLIYLVKDVLLMNRDSGSVVLIPLKTEAIKHFLIDKEVKFWGILKNYFPNCSKKNLEAMVSNSQWLNKSISLKQYKVFFPTRDEFNDTNQRALSKKYSYAQVYSVSNVVYSPDRQVCLMYITGYDEGAFTVELKKDIHGKWASHIITTDWIV